MNSYKAQFVSFLVESGALRFGSFTTKSGRQTPYFINTGQFCTGATLSSLADYYAIAVQNYFTDTVDNLFGPAYKGIPLVASTALALHRNHHRNLTFTFNRKEAKQHGEGGVLVGDTYDKPTRVLIVEDVITAGTSVRETLALLAKFPHVQVVGLLVSVDRRERLDSGLSALQEVEKQFGLRCYSVIDIDDILHILADQNLRTSLGVSQQIFEQIELYRNKWGVIPCS